MVLAFSAGISAGRLTSKLIWNLKTQTSEFCASVSDRRRLFDALEGAKDSCLLGEQFCWHLVLPDPVLPLRRAPRLDPPVVCPGFGLDRFGLHGISLVRASGATFKRRVFVALGVRETLVSWANNSRTCLVQTSLE